MNNKLFVLSMGIAIAGTIPTTRAEQKGGNRIKKPNVVFILADDLGWSDLGCYGSSFYETPNIDKFAQQGVRFTNAYAACHVCSPSRASILTGKYPARLHLTDWLPGRKDFTFQKLKNVVSEQHLANDETTLPGTLKANGYRTAIFGKWHLGDDSASTTQQGFDLHIPEWNNGWPNGTYFSPYGMKGLEGGSEGEYLTDRLTSEALKFIDENKEVPFFLYLSHFAVHDPIQGRPDLVKKYQQKLERMQPWDKEPFILEGNPDTSEVISREKLNRLLYDKPFEGYSVLPQRTVKIKQRQDNVQFAAMVESLDESVGRVLTQLKASGIEDNTIVIFFSDNGGMSAANFGKPTRIIPPANLDKAFSTSNLPLRGGKGWLYEGGIRVPLMVKWPQQGKKGIVCDVPVISTDFFKTVLDMIDLPLDPEKYGIDGMSIVPLLKQQKNGQKKIAGRAIFWHFPHYSNHGMQSPGSAVRMGDFKLLEYFENNIAQLFNLKTDPGEQHDLSQSHPDKVRELRALLHSWRVKVNAQMMTEQ